MRKTILAALPLLMLAAPASADPRNFTLSNDTGKTIDELYISPADVDEWEEDVLGVDTLAADDETDVDFEQDDRETCEYDLKIVFDDDTSAVWEDINLCEITDVSVFYDDSGEPESQPDEDDDA